MENSQTNNDKLSEKEQAQHEFTQHFTARKAEIEEKFNMVNQKLSQLKLETDKLLHPEKK